MGGNVYSISTRLLRFPRVHPLPPCSCFFVVRAIYVDFFFFFIVSSRCMERLRQDAANQPSDGGTGSMDGLEVLVLYSRPLSSGREPVRKERSSEKFPFLRTRRLGRRKGLAYWSRLFRGRRFRLLFQVSRVLYFAHGVIHLFVQTMRCSDPGAVNGRAGIGCMCHIPCVIIFFLSSDLGRDCVCTTPVSLAASCTYFLRWCFWCSMLRRTLQALVVR